MTTASLPCFHATSLRTGFARQTSLARANGELSQAECDLLLQLCLSPWQAPSQLRLDRLSARRWPSHEFADALMISATRPEITTVFLSLPLRALERFSDRHTLHRALQDRYGDGSDVDISAIELQGSPFDYWMANLLGRQQGFVERLDDTLLKLPGLGRVMHDTLEADLARLSPETVPDPGAWAWHVSAITQPTEVRQTRTLSEVALDDFCQVEPPQGTRLTLVAPRGDTLAAPRLQQYIQAIDHSINRLNAPFDEAITRFWQLTGVDDITHSHYAARALGHLFYLALLRASHEGRVADTHMQWLRSALRPTGAIPSVHSLALHSGQRAAIELAGVFALSDTRSARRGLYLFSARDGLRHFPGPDAISDLAAWLIHGDQQVLLKEAMGLSNHAPYKVMKRIEVRLSTIITDVFAHRLDSVIALQRANLPLAIAQRGNVPAQVAASLDDAIDVRGLLAPALLHLQYSPRWASGQTPTLASITSTGPTLEVSSANGAALLAQLATLHQAQPGLGTCLHYLIARQLALFGLPRLDVDDLWIVPDTGSDSPRQPLLIHALHQLINPLPVPLTDDCLVTDSAGALLARLDARLLNALVTQLSKTARGTWIRRLNYFNTQALRVGSSQIDAHRLSLALRQQALRAELPLLAHTYPGQPWARKWLAQVLNHPTRRMRQGSGLQEGWIEVNRVSLRLPHESYAIEVSNVMALTQGLDPGGHVVLCSHLLGVMVFSSLAQVQAELNRLMRQPAGQASWLALIAEQYHPALSTHLRSLSVVPLTLELAPVDGDYAQYLQRSDETRRIFNAQAALSRARSAHYSAALLLASVDDSAAPTALADQLGEIVSTLRGAELKRQLPAWLERASADDLTAYQANLQRLRVALAMPVKYLFGIKSAMTYATEQVWTYLSVDFPEDYIDPAKVRVKVAQRFSTGLHLSAASAGMISGAGVVYPALDMSLIEYTLQRAIAVPDMPIEISLEDGSPVVAGLTADYVMQMANRLDTAARYLRRLEAQFSHSDAHYGQRRTLFHQQIVPTLMDAAIEAKLNGALSAKAYGIIEGLLQMPDSLARDAQQHSGHRIRPLALLAAEGLAADIAAGVYLLGAAPTASGPVVLMATFHDVFLFREYRDEADLMQQLRAEGDLQTLVLARVETAVRARYSHGGLTVPRLELAAAAPFEHPMAAPPQTRLAYLPEQGNTLNYLFEESLKYLLRLAKAQVVTSAQADHAANLSLLKLLVESGLAFVNGRIALVLGFWQSAEWLKSAVTAAWIQDWGRAVSQLGAAVTILLTQRVARNDRLALPAPKATPPGLYTAEWITRFSDIPPMVRARLRSLVANEVSLAALTPDTTPGVYLDPITGHRYAPVAGLVFQVRKLEGTWTITADRREGPALRRNAQGHLEMDLGTGLRGGGGGWSDQRRSRKRQREIDKEFITEATGMAQIRLGYPLHAARIVCAQRQARRYLERSMDALAPARGQPQISTASQHILEDFFGRKVASPALVSEVRQIAAAILTELMDASLDPRFSKRYVTGFNKLGLEWVVAFTDDGDPLRRIFLTEKFFDVPTALHTTLAASHQNFDAPMHFRATALIHELSHVVHGTGDLAYIEASAPYLDMIDTTQAKGRALLARLTQIRRDTLSAYTPQAQLFTVVENGLRRDLNEADGDAHEYILRHSKQPTLAGARSAFVADEQVRKDILLANADSVALLITLLARDTGAVP